jgi:hypothetical protein
MVHDAGKRICQGIFYDHILVPPLAEFSETQLFGDFPKASTTEIDFVASNNCTVSSAANTITVTLSLFSFF